MGKNQKRNKCCSKRKKKRREERLEVRKIDEETRIASIEDETWDGIVYKDTFICCNTQNKKAQTKMDWIFSLFK